MKTIFVVWCNIISLQVDPQQPNESFFVLSKVSKNFTIKSNTTAAEPESKLKKLGRRINSWKLMSLIFSRFHLANNDEDDNDDYNNLYQSSHNEPTL